MMEPVLTAMSRHITALSIHPCLPDWAELFHFVLSHLIGEWINGNLITNYPDNPKMFLFVFQVKLWNPVTDQNKT